MLCTECGYNESFFIEECLPGIFYNWYEPILDDLSNLNGGFFDATQDNSMFDESLFPIDEDPFPIDEENDEVINDE